MKRTAITVTLSLALIFLTASALLVNIAKANYFPPPSIEIFSPIPAPDVNSNSNVRLGVRVNVLPSEPDITHIRYSLDEKANVTLTNLTKEDNVWYWTSTKGVFAQGKAFSVEASLGNLADGDHTLIVFAQYADGKEMSRSREFTLDTNYKSFKPTELLLLSPLNQTYITSELPLTFAVNETVQSASYVLDNRGGNVSLSFAGNTTLTGLSDGMHKLTVTVWTERSLASRTTFFTVAASEPESEPFPTLAVAAAFFATVVVVGGLLVYFKKRRRQSQPFAQEVL